MNATAEPIIYIIRVGKCHYKHGDPWEFSVACAYNGETAWLHAGQGTVTREIWQAVGKVLKELGFKRAAWERVNADGSFRMIERDIR